MSFRHATLRITRGSITKLAKRTATQKQHLKVVMITSTQQSCGMLKAWGMRGQAHRHKASLGVVDLRVRAMLGAVDVLHIDGHAKVRDPAVLTGEAESPVDDENGDEAQDGVEPNFAETHIRGSRPDDPAHMFCTHR